jgi:release factor glutamine methyltransferase
MELFTIFSTPRIPKLDFERVYEPAEDSFLLLDSFEKEHEYLLQKDPLFVVEVGSGSGVVITFLQQILGHQRVYFATDINSVACLGTKETCLLNQQPTEIINTKFTQSIRLEGLIDVLVFNPPYVLTLESELGQSGIEASYAGGANGRVVIDEFLNLVDSLLSPQGILYLVLINENNPDEISHIMKTKGFNSELVLYRKAGWEGLSVYKYIRA